MTSPWSRSADGNSIPAARIVTVGAWVSLVALSWVAISIAIRDTHLAWFTVPAQSLVPLIFLPVWVGAPLALYRKQWGIGAVGLAVVGSQILLVVPAMGSHPLPAWAASAPKITIESVNVWDENPTPDAAARTLVASHADVLVLVEVADSMQRALVRAGINHRFPHQLRALARKNGTNDGIYSRLPLAHETLISDVVNDLPAATVTRGGRSLRIVAVHIDGPLHDREHWHDELTRLEPVARATAGPLVIVGDFNATRWNPPFRALLDARLTDAHEARGHGLSRSWPVRGTPLAAFGPLMRLDHALTNPRAAATKVREVDVPGSDHVGFRVTVAMNRRAR